MRTELAFRKRLTLASTIRAELGEAFDTPAQRAAWLRMLAEQIAREDGKPREVFAIDAASPEAAFLP